jgi:hypothetical protein
MHIGYGTRAVSSPIASGQIGRFSVPTRFIPLSQFFLQEKPKKGEKVIYGRQERSKAKGSNGARKSTAASDAPTAPPERGKKKEPEDEAQEGITTTANVPTVPVPLGGKLDRPEDEKKRRKKKDLPARMTLLLRRLF